MMIAWWPFRSIFFWGGVVLPSILNALGIVMNKLGLCQWNDSESETLLRWWTSDFWETTLKVQQTMELIKNSSFFIGIFHRLAFLSLPYGKRDGLAIFRSSNVHANLGRFFGGSQGTVVSCSRCICPHIRGTSAYVWTGPWRMVVWHGMTWYDDMTQATWHILTACRLCLEPIHQNFQKMRQEMEDGGERVKKCQEGSDIYVVCNIYNMNHLDV